MWAASSDRSSGTTDTTGAGTTNVAAECDLEEKDTHACTVLCGGYQYALTAYNILWFLAYEQTHLRCGTLLRFILRIIINVVKKHSAVFNVPTQWTM